MSNILEIINLSKNYHGSPALKNVNLSVKAGEIHGLVGANGSGKSTLMNILFGHQIIHETGGYQGQIRHRGSLVQIKNCSEAISLGIGMVHQEFALIPNLTISENIKLGREITNRFTDRLFGYKYSFVDKKRNNEQAAQILNKLGLKIDVGILVGHLSTNIKQFVEVARETGRQDLNLLLLDEPTATLNKGDAQQLLSVLRELAQSGVAVLFVSHRLEEIKQICDRVTVFRDGQVVSRYKQEELSITTLARDMIGHLVTKAYAPDRAICTSEAILFRNFSVDMPGEAIKEMNLAVYKGEILGLTSLSGHGKLALGYGVMGLYPTAGEVIYEGRKLPWMNARTNILKGIYVLPDDRQTLGMLLEHSVEDNIIFTGNQVKNLFARQLPRPFSGFLDHRMSRRYVMKLVQDFDIKCTGVKQKIKELSGGNQQKVCLARALTVQPQLLFVAEPTRGIDISAKEKILQMLIEINRNQQTTIVMASSELDELKRICDRIAILVEGRIYKILSPDVSDIEFGLALAGEESIEYGSL